VPVCRSDGVISITMNNTASTRFTFLKHYWTWLPKRQQRAWN